MPPGWKWIISFYGKVVTIIMYFIVTTYRNKTGNVCCDCVRYYRNDLCWIRVRIVTLNGNKIRWRSYVTYATKLQNDLWLTIVTKIQLYKIVVVIIIYWYRAVREQCSLTALYHTRDPPCCAFSLVSLVSRISQRLSEAPLSAVSVSRVPSSGSTT